MQRISGKSFDFTMNSTMISVDNISLDISDETAVSTTQGVPDGYTDGSVSAEGEIELSTYYFNLLLSAARAAGSFRSIPLQDFLFYARVGNDEMKVEAFGCKLTLAGLLSIDTSGGEKTKHKVKYIVTSPDFVRINGIPYLSADDTRNLQG